MLNKGAKGKIVLSLVLVIISANFVRSAVDALNSRKRLDEALEREKILIEQRDRLKDDVAYKKTVEYIEESARNELNMIKEGEKVYVVSDGAGSGNSPMSEVVLGTSDKPEKVKSAPNWYVWYKLFF